MGTTVVIIVVRSADSLVFSFTSESVMPVDLFEFITLIDLHQSSVLGSENSSFSDLEAR